MNNKYLKCQVFFIDLLHGFFVLEFNVLFVFEFFLVIGIKFKYRNSKFEIRAILTNWIKK